MSVIQFRCPTCDELITAETTDKTVYCPNCENRLDVQKEVVAQKIEVENEKKSYFSKLEKFKDNGDEALRNEKYADAVMNYISYLELDEKNLFVASSLVKACNLAIDKHYLTYESLYEQNKISYQKSSLETELSAYEDARKYALDILDKAGPNYEMRITPNEKKVLDLLNKKRKMAITVRIVSLILSITIFAVMVFLIFRLV